MERDLITRQQRVGMHRNLKFARGIAFIGFGVMALMMFTTVYLKYATAQVEFNNVHSFKPVH